MLRKIASLFTFFFQKNLHSIKNLLWRWPQQHLLHFHNPIRQISYLIHSTLCSNKGRNFNWLLLSFSFKKIRWPIIVNSLYLYDLPFNVHSLRKIYLKLLKVHLRSFYSLTHLFKLFENWIFISEIWSVKRTSKN